MIMKKVFNSLFVIIAAMVTFAGCAKQEIDAPATPETKTVQFFAESIETKTAFGTPVGNSYPTLWTANDKEVKLLLNLNDEYVAGVTASGDFTSASFNVDVKTDGTESPYQFCAISPSTVFLGKNDERFAVTIPTSQTPLKNSVDEAAQILYALSDSFDEIPETVDLDFKHFTAYGNLSFTNLNLGDAKVTSIAITSSIDFANRWNCFVDDESFGENSGASTITLITSATENLWFACAPVGDMNGKTLTFTINTDKGPLVKTVTLGAKHKFESGRIAKMTVDMKDIEFEKSKVYELVTDASELTLDSEIIIVASDYNFALSTTQNGNNRGQAAVNKSEDKSTITDPGNDVQVLIIGEGASEETISLNTGVTYLYAPGGGNYLRETTTLNENASWNISVTEGGIATIKASRNDRNWMRYNSSNNPPIFSCYTSGQTDVSIYKLQGTGSAPLPKLSAPVVTAGLNDDETGVNVSWNKVENATSYVISGIGDDVETTETSYSFIDVASGTYTVTVTAKADGYKSASSETSVTVPYVNTGSAKTYTLTIVSGDLEKKSGSGYAAYNGTHTLKAYASDNSTMDVVINTSQVMPGSNPSGTLQFQASKGTLYNVTDLGTIVSVDFEINQGSGISAVIGTIQNPTTETAGGSYFVVKKTTSSAGYLNSITITFQK